MEYATPVWSPYLKNDIRALERVRRRATISSTGQGLIYGETYSDGITILTLEYRRKRADMIQVYGILHGIDDTSPETFFTRSHTSTRGHSWKLHKQSLTTERQNSFPNRVVDPWNNLPMSVVTAESLNVFISRLNSV
jgi:hypothetical protein